MLPSSVCIASDGYKVWKMILEIYLTLMVTAIMGNWANRKTETIKMSPERKYIRKQSINIGYTYQLGVVSYIEYGYTILKIRYTYVYEAYVVIKCISNDFNTKMTMITSLTIYESPSEQN